MLFIFPPYNKSIKKFFEQQCSNQWDFRVFFPGKYERIKCIVGAGLLYSLGINLFVVPSLRPKQESDKTAVEAPPNVIAADTAMEELTERPALPASTADEAPGWN